MVYTTYFMVMWWMVCYYCFTRIFFFGGDPLIPLVQNPFQIESLLWTESVPHGTRGANAHGYC